MKDVKFCLAFVHSPSSFHSRTKKIVVPDDIKGMKIRPAHATMANFVTSARRHQRAVLARLKCATSSSAASPTRVTFPWGSLVLFGIDKVTKYRHGGAALRHDLRLRDQQGQVQRDVRQAEEGDRQQLQRPRCAGMVGEHWGKFEDAGIDKIKAEAGHEVYKLTPEQVAAWKKAAEPLVKTWGEGVKKTGADPDAALTELKAALNKYNALAQ